MGVDNKRLPVAPQVLPRDKSPPALRILNTLIVLRVLNCLLNSAKKGRHIGLPLQHTSCEQLRTKLRKENHKPLKSKLNFISTGCSLCINITI